jgi:hypothetical protein
VNVSPGEGIQLGIHWPTCIDRSCPGCMPGLDLSTLKRAPEELDLSIFRKDVR